YEMTIAGKPPDDLSGYTDARIALNLERNLPYVDQWLSLPRHHVFVPPRRFGEIGHDINGVIVNYDTWAYQERIDLLHDSGALDRLSPTARVLEIGGGYGALAYWFKQAYPGCAYAIVDLPECLLFSGLYLGLSDVAFRAVPNYAADALQEPRSRHQHVIDERDERRTGAPLHPVNAEVLARRGRGVFRTEPRQPDDGSVERPRPHRRGLAVSSRDRDALSL